MLPTVAIIGRPNVGKSTLFNRLVGKKLALVDDTPGVTRDRRFGDANLLGMPFTIVDTAGWEDLDPETLPGRMRQQTEASLIGADVALFVIDARAGLTPNDRAFADFVDRADIPAAMVQARRAGFGEGNKVVVRSVDAMHETDAIARAIRQAQAQNAAVEGNGARHVGGKDQNMRQTDRAHLGCHRPPRRTGHPRRA